MKKVFGILLTLVLLLSTFGVMTSAASLRKLDMAFVIDTTGSMSDDISRVKKDMKEYLDDLNESGMDYRIAIIDYRDFSSRTGSSGDYPYKVQLDFTNNYDAIINGINGLSLGDGGDTNETVYSALTDGLDALSWRSEAGKAAILMGDAPALDPEPITGYTYESVVKKLNGNGVGLDSSGIKTTAVSRSPITLFGIATSSNSATVKCFEKLASATGGKSYTATSSAQISGIVEEIINVEIPETVEDASSSSFWLFDIFGWIFEFFMNILFWWA